MRLLFAVWIVALSLVSPALAESRLVRIEGKSFIAPDGRTTHDTPERRERDRLKNRICASAGLELLRVDSPFLGRFGPYRLLSYLTECWFMFRSFEEAEERGELGPYADFDPRWAIELRPDGRGTHLPYAVDLPVRVRIQRLH